jgi:carboxyl-terminal processing protease
MLMDKKRIAGILAVFVVIILVFFFTAKFARVRALEDLEEKLEIYLRALEIVKSEYIEKDVDNTKLVYGSIKGMLESLDDPYTRFMEPTAFKEMNIRMSGSYSGIGIYIGIKEKHLVVISPIDDTPAKLVGLKARDKIVSVDSKSTKNMALEEAVSLIRGPEGTEVVLGILRDNWEEPRDFSIIRKRITIKSVVRKNINDDIYYIKLNTFENQNAANEMEKALIQAKTDGAKGLILDLRNNGGGLLRIAVDIGSMFIDDGVIVYTVDREGRRETISSIGGHIWDKPMVVLVNESSASASEILAGALNDNGIATLVGTHTFGKAYVQNVRQLDDGSAILLTVAKYYTPNGLDITEKGIIPDFIVELPDVLTSEADGEIEEKEADDDDDRQLEKAIEILEGEIKGTHGTKVGFGRSF